MLPIAPLQSCNRVTRNVLPKILRAGLRTAPRQTKKHPNTSSPAPNLAVHDVPFTERERIIKSSSSFLTGPANNHGHSDPDSKAWTKKPFPIAKLQYRWETPAPTTSQLEYADRFFTRSRPEFLWSAPKFHSMSFGDSPEVCVLGRSNIGKSSLLNALFGTEVAHSSSKPGRTKMMNAFGVGSDANHHKNRLVVLDMPGYGHGGQSSWGTEILKYLSQRKQLVRTFVLVDSQHGLKPSDEQLLALFRKKNVPHQVIFAKVDKLLFSSSKRMPSESQLHTRLQDLEDKMVSMAKDIQPDQEDECGALGEIVACSSESKINGYRIGIDLVRHAMLQATELELKLSPKKLVETPEIVSWSDLGLKDDTVP